jgi:diguanylate cyclase (GGDEF)-like protein
MREESNLIRGLPRAEEARNRCLRAILKALHLSNIAFIGKASDGIPHRLVFLEGGNGGNREAGPDAFIHDLGAAAGVVSTSKPLLLNPDNPMPIRVPYSSGTSVLSGAMAVPVVQGIVWADRARGPISVEEFESFQDLCKLLEEQTTVLSRINEAAGHVQDLTDTVEGARAILASGSERNAIAALAEATLRQSRAQLSLVMLFEREPGTAVIVGGDGTAAGAYVGKAFDYTEGMIGLAVRSGIVVPSGLRYLPAMGTILGPTVPLEPNPGDPLLIQLLGSTTEPIGALVLLRGEFQRLTMTHGVRTLCDCTALLLHQFRLREQVSRDAMLDGLTGLFNRRAFMSRLAESVAYRDRHGTELTLLMLDADHFKRINDEFGHPVGDRVLRVISDTIRTCMRGSDFAGRYGGEEFAIVLPHTGTQGGRVVAERIRNACESTAIPAGARTVVVTVSIGGAAAWNGAKRPEDLILRADQALYEAKRTGRNRVILND